MTALKRSFFEKSVGLLLIALAGPLIWALHFAVVYGVQHIACTAFGAEHSSVWVQVIIIVATVIALLALVLLAVKPEIGLRISRYGVIEHDTRSFLAGLMQLLALLSCFGVLWAGSAVLFLPVCDSLV